VGAGQVHGISLPRSTVLRVPLRPVDADVMRFSDIVVLGHGVDIARHVGVMNSRPTIGGHVWPIRATEGEGVTRQFASWSHAPDYPAPAVFVRADADVTLWGT
jgi:hypothetical protein